MRSTKVLALSVSNGRKIFYAGETVTEQSFPRGEFDKLIEKGFLHPVDGDDDGEKPNFDEDDQPELKFGKDVVPQMVPQLPGIPPMFIQQPPIAPTPDSPKPVDPVVPGTPNVDYAKPKTKSADDSKTDLDLVVPDKVETEGEKKGTLKDQGYLDAQKTTTEKIDELVKGAESKGTGAATDFSDLLKKSETDEPSLNQMRKDLKERGVKVPPTATKEEILKLWASGS